MGGVVMVVVELLGCGGGHMLLRVGACWHDDGRRCWWHDARGVAMALVCCHGVGSDAADTAPVALLLFTGVVVQQPGYFLLYKRAYKL